MPIDYSHYPPNWKSEIVPRIRERAGNKCERCGVLNHAWIVRLPKWFMGPDGWIYVTGPKDIIYDIKPTRIICTTAHVGPNKHDKMNAKDEELLFLCQKCHLGEDLQDHIRHRRENRYVKLGILTLDLQ